MASKQRPPLTPADSSYLGTIVGDLELIRWQSQSRDGVRHYTNGTVRGAENCSCEWRAHHPGEPCKHMLAFVDALRHHLGEPPPADPGGAPACPDCGRPCDLRDMDDGDAADVWRWTCDRCRTAWPPTRLPVPPADPGGARCGTCDEPLAPGAAGSCAECRTAFARVEGYLEDEAADPGGAPLDAAQGDVDREINDWVLGGKLSPPPWLVAPSERKRRHDEAMIDLYGG